MFRSPKQYRLTATLAACAFAITAISAINANAQAPNPYASNNGTVPPRSQYSGPLFQLSYAYPQTAPAPAAPWQTAIGNGRISVQNASAYVQALKASISADMRVLLLDYASWDAAERGWYNEPWLGGKREPIHGAYLATTDFPKALFAGSGFAGVLQPARGHHAARGVGQNGPDANDQQNLNAGAGRRRDLQGRADRRQELRCRRWQKTQRPMANRQRPVRCALAKRGRFMNTNIKANRYQ